MLEAGTILQDRYRVISQLGQGGMGAVYYAWDMRLSVPVALKEMLAQADLAVEVLDDLREQFQQEARVLARLSHPNLVAVTDFFEEETNAYLVMKYVEGESLADRIRRVGAVPEDQVLEVARQLLDALAYCHGEGVIHRDVKPANIIIRSDGQMVLVDFGLVKLWDPYNPKTQTAIRGVGTPQYAPPEQYETAVGHTGPRSDLYSVGATLYYALSGKVPPTATLRIASPEAFEPLRAVASDVSERTASAVERAVELARADRWEDAPSMAKALGLSIRSRATGGAGSTRGDRQAETVRMVGAGASSTGTRKGFLMWILGAVGIAGLAGVTVLALILTGVVSLSAISPPTPIPTPEPVTETPLPKPSPTFTPTPPAASSTPTPSSTPEPTETVAARMKATDTTTPTPTLTPTPTATPEAATSTPTIGPSVTPTSGSQEPTPTPTSAPVATGALIGFETWGTWRRGDQPYGELVQVQDPVRGGSHAAKLTYDFPASGEDYVVFLQRRAISGEPNRFSAWVYGDGSGHFLNLWIQDAQDEVWSVSLGMVGSAGWQQMTGSLAPGLAWPNGRISGPDNGTVDYPVRFYALILDRPGAGALKGEIVLDEIEAWQGEIPSEAVNPDGADDDTSATDEPVNPDEVGRILYTVESGGAYLLYATDPSWNEGVKLGSTTWANSTCGSGLTASTLAGTTYTMLGETVCGVTERTDACSSPDGAYKLVTNFLEGWKYDVLLQSTSDGSSEWYYNGSVETAFGIRWAANSRVVAFGVGSTVNVIQVGGTGYHQVVSAYDNQWLPRLSPDGAWSLYLQPGGADVFVAAIPDGGSRNLTNDASIVKLCPRWRP
jgi:eukaryotic-like serine/threonine-protein kinase